MKNRKAFTLVELLVVVAIIALLVSILLPALGQARESAKKVVCLTLLKSFGLSNMTYASANNGRFVPYSQEGSSDAERLGGNPYWDERWPENMEFREILSLAERAEIKNSNWEDPFIFPRELRCPSHDIKSEEGYMAFSASTLGWRVMMSYAMNTEKWRSAGWWPNDKKYRGILQGQVKRGADVAMFIESNNYLTRYERANYLVYWDVFGDRWASEKSSSVNNGSQVSYRHNEGCNIAYFDGHAGYLPKEEVYDLDNPVAGFNVSLRRPHPLWDFDSEGLVY